MDAHAIIKKISEQIRLKAARAAFVLSIIAFLIADIMLTLNPPLDNMNHPYPSFPLMTIFGAIFGIIYYKIELKEEIYTYNLFQQIEKMLDYTNGFLVGGLIGGIIGGFSSLGQDPYSRALIGSMVGAMFGLFLSGFSSVLSHLSKESILGGIFGGLAGGFVGGYAGGSIGGVYGFIYGGIVGILIGAIDRRIAVTSAKRMLLDAIMKEFQSGKPVVIEGMSVNDLATLRNLVERGFIPGAKMVGKRIIPKDYKLTQEELEEIRAEEEKKKELL